MKSFITSGPGLPIQIFKEMSTLDYLRRYVKFSDGKIYLVDPDQTVPV